MLAPDDPLVLERMARHVALVPIAVRRLKGRVPGCGPDDLFQEGLIALWRGCRCYDAARSRPATFLLRVINNRLLDLVRRRRWRLRPLEAPEAAADPASGRDVAAVDARLDCEAMGWEEWAASVDADPAEQLELFA